MNLDNITPDGWWKKYKSMQKMERYDFLKKYLEEGLSRDFVKEIDLVDIIIGVSDFLIRDRQYDKVLELQDLLHKQEPEILGNESYYADSYALNVHLFEDEISLAYDIFLADDDLANLHYEYFREDKRSSYQKLAFGFSKNALQEKGINFPTSLNLWESAWENFSFGNPEEEETHGLDSFFNLEERDFYDYINERFGFFPIKRPYAFAVLWGIQYVYTFLKTKLLISHDDYNRVCEFIKYTKMELTEGLGDGI